jgi:transitional endoplasmic reticulum ATPase
MAEKELKLKVAEAIQDDVNKGIVRIDSGYMSEVEIKSGDIVEIEGERKTVAIADRSYPGDIGLNIIRMDGIIRKNGKTGIGEIVKVRKAIVKEAKKVIIAPARKGIVIRASSEIFKQGLLGRAVVKGDIVSLGGARRRKNTMMNNPFFDEDIFTILDESMMGVGFGDIKFVVVDTNPKQPVIILDQTEIEFRSEAVEVEEERVPDISYEDVGGLEEEIKKVREMVELPLKHPEIFERLGIEAPKGVLLHASKSFPKRSRNSPHI